MRRAARQVNEFLQVSAASCHVACGACALPCRVPPLCAVGSCTTSHGAKMDSNACHGQQLSQDSGGRAGKKTRAGLRGCEANLSISVQSARVPAIAQRLASGVGGAAHGRMDDVSELEIDGDIDPPEPLPLFPRLPQPPENPKPARRKGAGGADSHTRAPHTATAASTGTTAQPQAGSDDDLCQPGSFLSSCRNKVRLKEQVHSLDRSVWTERAGNLTRTGTPGGVSPGSTSDLAIAPRGQYRTIKEAENAGQLGTGVDVGSSRTGPLRGLLAGPPSGPPQGSNRQKVPLTAQRVLYFLPRNRSLSPLYAC